MIYPKIPLAQSIIEICLAKDVTNIVISPGSRNAPLIIGFVNNPKFTCYSIADERAAAFFALGIAQQIKKPVAVICTSGSAVLNYYPAFAEAFYSQISLVVISADRPLNKIDIGDGQTIRQQNVFENHSICNANLAEGASFENDLKINEALTLAIQKKGPVHINAPFEEPLYETTETLSVTISSSPNPTNSSTLSKTNWSEFASIWNNSKKKLVLVGVNNPNSIDSKIVEFLAKDSSVVVLTETTSNLHHTSFITSIDTLITPFTTENYLNFQPDILITFGGMVVSKRIKSMLRKYQPKNHWHIDSLRAYDTFGCLTKHFVMEPNSFFTTFIPLTEPVSSDYSDTFAAITSNRKIKHSEYLSKIPFSDFKAFEILFQNLPLNSHLQISNSSAIRYAQLFEIDSTIEVFCNRGTSGIDGSTSTAIGAAVAQNKPTTLITGDISFLYDSNALWNNYIPKDFKIILINNGGGGIFRILPGHQETPVFTTFFETSHCLTAEHLAKMFGFEYRMASDELSLKAALQNSYTQNDIPVLLEVFTPTRENDTILLRYFDALK